MAVMSYDLLRTALLNAPAALRALRAAAAFGAAVASASAAEAQTRADPPRDEIVLQLA